jgi:trehalose/maltose hydrolase-like predicted phosphorylase
LRRPVEITQYVSIRYTERLAEAGIEPSVGNVGSSLSAALHGVAAARLGQGKMAMRFFRQASATDLANTHATIDGSVHIAALGGLWMMAVLGFAGLTMDACGLCLDPRLPND